MAQIKWLSDIRSYHTAGVDSFQLYGGLDLVAFSITKALFVVMVILAGTPESLNLNCGEANASAKDPRAAHCCYDMLQIDRTATVEQALAARCAW